MVKRIGRRFVSLLLTFVTILTLLPTMTLPALAATSGDVTGLTDSNIGLSFSGDADDAWSAKGTTIIGAATSTGGCSTTHYSSTLTIKNEGSTTARLSFGYAIEQNSGTIQVGGKNVPASGTFTKELAPNDTATVYIKSGSTAAATKITMTDVKLEASATATVTFQPAENGSYTVDGKDITTEAYTNTQSSLTAYKVIATPADGYQFLGWYDATNKSYLPGGASSSIFVSSDNSKVTAKFGKIGTKFQVGTTTLKWDNLNDAIISTRNNSSGYVKQLESCTISGEYTIPSGVTLLIPFNEDGMLYKATPSPTTSQADAKVFRTLTMAADSSITLENGAAISVGGQYYASSGGSKGKMAGPYGCIKMEDGSTITVQNGASLYAWGFISGNGAVTVESGGSVYEWYQILDFRGGTASTQMGNKVFPFNQYAVQNIEVPLTVHAGATETAYSGVNALGGIKPTSLVFIGEEGLFKVVSGSLTKAYDGSTDRIHYTINGVAALNTLSLKLAGISVNSADYVLPLTNNMTVNLSSGSKLTLNQTVALLPGVEVTIGRDAELIVSQDQSMYIYDVDEWGKYCSGGENNSKFIPVVYAPGRTGSRPPLEDVKVEVNGKLTANGGIYTTKGGADICSSGGGRYYQQGAPGKETVTYQYDGGPTKHDIPITAAKLHNFDGTYTETKDANVGKTFTYCTCAAHKGGEWVPDLQVAAIIDGNGAQVGTYATLQEAVDAYEPDDSTAPKNYIQMLHSTTGNVDTDKNLYLDLNGCTVTGDFTMRGKTLHGMDSATDKYDGTNAGKIVGAVSGYAKTYQTPTETTAEGETYDRYVAILSEENGTSTLSFHRFNISVTGYRFELAAPECALFFIGKFQGDDAAKNHLTELGFTLKGNNDKPLGEDSYKFTAGTDFPPMPAEGEASDSKVVRSGDDFLFEVYLKRSFDKENRNGYTEEISATARAKFDNGGEQQSDPRNLSFEDAWTEPEGLNGLTPEQKTILDNFLNALGITNP